MPDALQLPLIPDPPPRAAAEARRDHGIQTAEAHAAALSPVWMDEATEMLGRWCDFTEADFLAEDFVAWCGTRDLAAPLDGRAWGEVFRRGAKQGIIRRVGYAPANTSNRSPKCLWRRVRP